MSISLRLLAFGAALAFAGTTFAATPTAPVSKAPPVAAVATKAPVTKVKVRTAAQQRMATCSKEATGKKGAERRAFMSSCMRTHDSATATAHRARKASAKSE